jgi:CheY-like chemotaxis protein
MSKILVIQDEEMNQDNLLRRLIRRGHTVQSFAEVEAGLRRAREEKFQLILLDMNLADRNGWEAARRFKEDAATRDLPIIALADNELEGAEAMARDAGCVDFEHRPVDLERLLGKMQPLLDRVDA